MPYEYSEVKAKKVVGDIVETVTGKRKTPSAFVDAIRKDPARQTWLLTLLMTERINAQANAIKNLRTQIERLGLQPVDEDTGEWSDAEIDRIIDRIADKLKD